MKRPRKISKSRSKKNFRRNAGVKKINFGTSSLMRGGIRL